MFIELQEQPDPHIAPRRLYVNVNAIAYISAPSETAPSVLTFCCAQGATGPSAPVLAVAEDFATVQNLIDIALTRPSTPVDD